MHNSWVQKCFDQIVELERKNNMSSIPDGFSPSGPSITAIARRRSRHMKRHMKRNLMVGWI